jgi:hypothetical protein
MNDVRGITASWMSRIRVVDADPGKYRKRFKKKLTHAAKVRSARAATLSESFPIPQHEAVTP